MRLRSIVVLGLLGVVVYRLTPPERRSTWRGRVRELGRVLVITIVVYWIWILLSSWLSA